MDRNRTALGLPWAGRGSVTRDGEEPTNDNGEEERRTIEHEDQSLI